MSSTSDASERHEPPSRLQWVTFFRFAVILGCLLILGIRRGSPSFAIPLAWAFWLLIVACALNLVHALLVQFVARPQRWALGQLAIDVFLVSALIYLSGGVVSYFNVLYFAVILGAGAAFSGQAALFMASLSTVLLSVVSTLYFLGAYYHLALPAVPRSWLREVTLDFPFILSYLTAQGIAFHVVAFLSLLLETRARRSEVLQQTLLRDLSEGVIALDEKGRLLYINDEARKMLGFPPLLPIVGKHWDQVFRRASDRPLRELLFSRQAMHRTLELERGNGKILVDVKTSPLMDKSGQRVIAVLGDLSLHQRAEQAERRADQLEQVAEMAASLAHELRNPLTAIRACVQELAHLQPVDDDARRLIEITCKESDRLNHIISEFLGFARMRPPNLRPFDLTSLLRDTALLLEKRCKPGVAVRLDLDGPLPCRGDSEQLQQAFLNLGVNALEAMEEQGTLFITGRRLRTSAPRLQGMLASSSDGVEITFRDTGPGIASEDIERIFLPFFTTKKGGTGLGLPIASRIVKAHGGRIDVTSEPGRGTAFTVWLPSGEDASPLSTFCPKEDSQQ